MKKAFTSSGYFIGWLILTFTVNPLVALAINVIVINWGFNEKVVKYIDAATGEEKKWISEEFQLTFYMMIAITYLLIELVSLILLRRLFKKDAKSKRLKAEMVAQQIESADKLNQLKKLQEDESQRLLDENVLKFRASELKVFDLRKGEILKEFDNNNNGILDIVDGGNDFMTILNQHQNEIISLEKNYNRAFIHQFVKLAGYLHTKSQNLQKIFVLVSQTKPNHEGYSAQVYKIIQDSINQGGSMDISQITSKYDYDYTATRSFMSNLEEIGIFQSSSFDNYNLLVKNENELIEIMGKNEIEKQSQYLKNQIYSYNTLVLHSLNMLTALLHEKMITFYEIYEVFDKLSIFNSNWENNVSTELAEIKGNLNELLISFERMEINLLSAIEHLTYMNQESFQELKLNVSKELSGINSKLNLNNLINGVQAYQLYKINGNIKSLKK